MHDESLVSEYSENIYSYLFFAFSASFLPFQKVSSCFFYYYFLEFEANVQLYLESGIENAG